MISKPELRNTVTPLDSELRSFFVDSQYLCSVLRRECKLYLLSPPSPSLSCPSYKYSDEFSFRRINVCSAVLQGAAIRSVRPKGYFVLYQPLGECYGFGFLIYGKIWEVNRWMTTQAFHYATFSFILSETRRDVPDTRTPRSDPGSIQLPSTSWPLSPFPSLPQQAYNKPMGKVAYSGTQLFWESCLTDSLLVWGSLSPDWMGRTGPLKVQRIFVISDYATFPWPFYMSAPSAGSGGLLDTAEESWPSHGITVCPRTTIPPQARRHHRRHKRSCSGNDSSNICSRSSLPVVRTLKISLLLNGEQMIAEILIKLCCCLGPPMGVLSVHICHSHCIHAGITAGIREEVVEITWPISSLATLCRLHRTHFANKSSVKWGTNERWNIN